jgi:heptosyltransferase-2/heptosyltransferase-3
MVELYLDFFNQMQQSQLLETNFELQKLNFDSEKNSVPVLRVDEAYNQSAERKLDNIGLKDEFIVLNTGGSWKTKRWPEEYFAETADQLAERGFNVLFVGGPSDKERVSYIINKVENKNKIFNLTGKTTLLELAAVLKRASLVVSGDTGPVHVAAAVGTNTLAIFGPSDEEKYAPRGRGKNILIKNVGLECRPCGEHECPLEHFKCMRELSPEMIVERILSEGMV